MLWAWQKKSHLGSGFSSSPQNLLELTTKWWLVIRTRTHTHMDDCHFFAAMVFVNLVTIFKVYCNITIKKGKGRKTLGYDFFSALDEIKGHYYIFSCFNVFFPILFFSPLKKTKQGSKCQRFGEKKFLSMSGPGRQCSGPSAVSWLCPMGGDGIELLTVSLTEEKHIFFKQLFLRNLVFGTWIRFWNLFTKEDDACFKFSMVFTWNWNWLELTKLIFTRKGCSACAQSIHGNGEEGNDGRESSRISPTRA